MILNLAIVGSKIHGWPRLKIREGPVHGSAILLPWSSTAKNHANSRDTGLQGRRRQNPGPVPLRFSRKFGKPI